MTTQNLQQIKANMPSVNPLKNMLSNNAVKAQFEGALGKNADAFMTSLVEVCSTNPDLLKCEPSDLIKVALKAAGLKLPISNALGYAYIVSFYDKNQGKLVPTLITGYKGLIQLCQRTGFYKNINAGIVYEGQFQGADMLTGEVKLDGNKKVSDKIVGYFAYFELLNGFKKTAYCTVEEMAKHARRNGMTNAIKKMSVEQIVELANMPLPDYKTVGWTGNFNSMAKKTMLRQLLGTYGYMSVEAQTQFGAEAQVTEQVAEDVTHIDVSAVDITPVEEKAEEVKAIEATTAQPADTLFPQEEEAVPAPTANEAPKTRKRPF